MGSKTNLAEPPPERYNDEAQTRGWCATKFRDMGFSASNTEELLNLGVDYRYAARTLDRGCLTETFMRIVR